MMETARPLFQWGQSVQAAADLFNDGTYPEQPADALLVGAGQRGEVVQIGQHVESGAAVYMVEFSPNQIVGCMEPELTPWQSGEEAQ
jgi:nitrogen fixation protein NifZ